MLSSKWSRLLLAVVFLFVSSCSSCSKDDPPPQTTSVPLQVESGFDFDQEAFVFTNFGGDIDAYKLTPSLVVRMFGEEAVCLPDASPCELSAPARAWMQQANTAMFQGRSEGFAIASLLFHAGQLSPSDFGADTAAGLSVTGNAALQQELAYWSATQFVPSALSEDERFQAKDVMPFLASALAPDSEKHYRLAIAQRTGDGFQRGHALVPIGYYKGEDGEYLLRLYDNNFPQQETRLSIKPEENSWRYEFPGLDGETIVYEGNEENGNLLYFSPIETRTGVLTPPFAEDSEHFTLVYSGVRVVSANEAGDETGVRSDGSIVQAEGEVVSPAFSRCPLCGNPIGIINQTMIANNMGSRVQKIEAADGVYADMYIDSEGENGEARRFLSASSSTNTTSVTLDGDNFQDEAVFGANGEVTYTSKSNEGMTITSFDGDKKVTVTIEGSDGSETPVKVTVKPSNGNAIEVEVEGLPEGKKVTVAVEPFSENAMKKTTVEYTSTGEKSTAKLDEFSNEVETSGAKNVQAGNCNNGVLDTELGEIAIDCGGSQCGGCKDGITCTADSDCLGSCTDGVCVSTTCANGSKDGDETDVDCGGALCAPCVATTDSNSPACLLARDCDSAFCLNNQCIKKAPVKIRVPSIAGTDPYGIEFTVELDGKLFTYGLRASETETFSTLGDAYEYRYVSSDFCWSSDYEKHLTGIRDAQDTTEEGIIDMVCPPEDYSTLKLTMVSSDPLQIAANDPAKIGVTKDGGEEQVFDYSGKHPINLGDFQQSWKIRVISSPLATDYPDPSGSGAMGGIMCEALPLYREYSGTYYRSDARIRCRWGQFSCQDGLRNQNESAVDCGGSCGKCPVSTACNQNSDCATNICAANICTQSSSCDNMVKDGDESDVDCGGTCGSRCEQGKACTQTSDCLATATCDNGFCGPIACENMIKDAGEGDVDCGGSCSTLCSDGQSCNMTSDCVAGATCTNNVCTVNHCTSGSKDGDETDVDCGGSCMTRCMSGAGCSLDSDCVMGLACNGGICGTPLCMNNMKDAGEGDIDCGGSCANKCMSGQTCNSSADCDTNLMCNNGTCGASPCANGVKDGDETDVDCGGSTCGACAVTQACIQDSDCASSDCECGASSGNCSSGGACGAGQFFIDQPTTDGTTASGTFTVPAACTSIYVQAWGAAGGGSGFMGFAESVGGAGGFIDGTLSVTPGDTITVWLGQGGDIAQEGSGSYLGASASGGANGFNMFGSDPGGGGGLTSVQITGGATQTFSVPAGAGSSEFGDPMAMSVMVTPGLTTTGYAGDSGSGNQGGGGAGDPGGQGENAGAYGTLPAGLTAYDSVEDPTFLTYVPGGTSNNDYSRCTGANFIPAGAGDQALGLGGDGCVVIRCVGQ